MRSLVGLVNVAQTRCRPPGVGGNAPLSKPRRKAAKRCRALMTRPALVATRILAPPWAVLKCRMFSFVFTFTVPFITFFT